MDPNLLNASLYVHIPFCTQRCSYCDFFFVTSRHGHEEFVNTLCLDVIQAGQRFLGTSLCTIYFGGGTPSRLPSGSIDQILGQIHDCFDTDQVSEITLEANPEDITESKLEELSNAGITRVSLGVQSFHDADLRFMNRCHHSDQAFRACSLIESAGFASWSLDMIFGVPGGSMQGWKNNLRLATEIGPPHISTYGLTIEPQTPLHKQVQRGRVTPVSDAQTADQFRVAMQVLRSADYEHYEVSSFARSGHRSAHNSRYWHHLNYIGLGPSAHSFWWQNGHAVRYENVCNLRTYSERVKENQSPVTFQETLTANDLAREKIMLALRTSEGLDLDLFEKKYQFSLIKEKRKELDTMRSLGIITWEETHIRLTDEGLHLCDQITEQLWPG